MPNGWKHQLFIECVGSFFFFHWMCVLRIFAIILINLYKWIHTVNFDLFFVFFFCCRSTKGKIWFYSVAWIVQISLMQHLILFVCLMFWLSQRIWINIHFYITYFHCTIVLCVTRTFYLGKIKNKRKDFGSFLVFSEKKRKKKNRRKLYERKKNGIYSKPFWFFSIHSNEIGLLLSSLSQNACNQFFETFKNGNLICLSLVWHYVYDRN